MVELHCPMEAGVAVLPLVSWVRREGKQCSLVVLAYGCKAAKAELFFLEILLRHS